MNKMLIAVFDNETLADAAMHALRKLHAEGDITLYAAGVIARDAAGKVSVLAAAGQGPVGTGVGLAVGAMIGLLGGGPVGMVVGAATGSMVGAVRDFWAAGVGLDFVEEAQTYLQPGKVALVAEIEEEWVIPVDSALEALGGQVIRRSRRDVMEAHDEQDVAAFKAEMSELEDEAADATGAAKLKLQTKLAKTQRSLESAMERGKQRVETLKAEADAKTASLKVQLGGVRDDVRTRMEDRVKRVKNAYHARGAKLSQAWELTKEALAA